MEHVTQSPTEHIAELEQRISLKPKSAKLLSRLAYLWEQCGDSSKAREYAKRAISEQPVKPFGYAALSTISKDFKEREDSLQNAIDRSENQSHDEQYVSALAGLLVRQLIESRRRNSHHSSNRHKGLSIKEKAVYQKVKVSLSKAWSSPEAKRDWLGQQEYKLGRFFRKLQPSEIYQPLAIQHLRKACENLKDATVANFWMGTLTDQKVEQCPTSYIVGLYASSFANRFDELLVDKLKYQTPTVLRRLMDQALATSTTCQAFRSVCDLGCGTGLSGLAFADCARSTMVGIDLSPPMAAKARDRGCYHDVMVGDVMQALAPANDTVWDLLIACDVLCYIGDLQTIFEATYQSLSSGGVWVCSTESLLDEKEDNDYQLGDCARFLHNPRYLLRLAEECGFQVIGAQNSTIRQNRGESVQGFLTILRKPSCW